MFDKGFDTGEHISKPSDMHLDTGACIGGHQLPQNYDSSSNCFTRAPDESCRNIFPSSTDTLDPSEEKRTPTQCGRPAPFV